MALLKLSYYGKIIVTWLAERNYYKIMCSGDIGYTLSQFFIYDAAITLTNNFSNLYYFCCLAFVLSCFETIEK